MRSRTTARSTARTTTGETAVQAPKSRKAIVARLTPKPPEPQSKDVAEAELGEDSPLYGVAMLRMALELKRSESSTFEEVLTRVLARMRLDEAPFRRYLEKNGGLLQSLRRA